MSYENSMRVRGSIPGLNSEDGRTTPRYFEKPAHPPVLSEGFDHIPDPKHWLAAPEMTKYFKVKPSFVRKVLDSRAVLATMGTYRGNDHTWFINIGDFVEKFPWIGAK